MAFTIAFSGKGGTGKSTIASLCIRHLTEVLKKTVLAVDADPNSCLGIELGLKVESSISDVREDVLKKKMELPPGMSKEAYIDYNIEQSIIESTGFDLLTMGRPEGPKCYCYVNNLLRKYLDKAASNYPYVVIDNEAGMEHLSRRTTNDVDVLLIVAEPNMVGVHTIERMKKMTNDLPITIKKKVLIINRVQAAGINEKIKTLINDIGLDIALELPYDQEIIDLSSEAKPLLDLPLENNIFKSVSGMIDKLLS